MSYLPPPPDTDYQRDSADRQANLQNQGLDLSQQSLGIQQGALGRAQNLAPQQYGLANQASALTTGELTNARDVYNPQYNSLQNQSFDLQQQGNNLTRQDFGLTRQGFGLTRQALEQAKTEGYRGMAGAHAARGATNAGWGHNWQVFLDDWLRQWAGQGITEQRFGLTEQRQGLNEQQLGLDQSRYGLNYQQGQEGLTNQISRQGLSDQERALAHNEQMARYTDTGQEMGLQGQRIDLSRQGVGLGLADTRENLAQQDLAYQALLYGG